MSSVDLAECEAVFHAAEQARERTRRRVSQTLAKHRENLAERKVINFKIEEKSKVLGQQSRLARRRLTSSNRDRARQKRAKCDALQAEISMLRAQRLTLEKEMAEHRRRLTESGYRELEEAYWLARHHYLAAIARSEARSQTKRRRKRERMKCAQLPQKYLGDSSLVWYYERHVEGATEVHFFFGGRTSPVREGNSPDGKGHGHYILVEPEGGAAYCRFRRLPK